MSGRTGKGLQIVLFYASAFILLLSDQLSKACVQRNLDPGESVPVIENIFHITLVKNTGAAFGLLRHLPGMFTAISILAAVFINYLYIKAHKNMNLTETGGLCLVLAGTLGNLMDRLREGAVVDFIDLRVWPVFNLADTWITVGAVMLGIGLLAGYREKQSG